MNDVELLGQALIKHNEKPSCVVLFSGNGKYGSEITLSEKARNFKRLVFTFRTSNAGSYHSVDLPSDISSFKVSMIDVETASNSSKGVDFLVAKLSEKGLLGRSAFEFTTVKRVKADNTTVVNDKETNFKCTSVVGYR